MRKFAILILLIFLVGIWPAYATNDIAAYDLKLEDLLEASVSGASKKSLTQVSLASKKSQSLTTTAAATYVISNDDIKRSGATNLPDVLRLAPGLDVARIDANKWAVSARGFNGRFANKLLVLIDGRTIYNPTFSGVYWENQDVLLEDIDRIEIIRGPGAALWGANAVNGVINVITKHSADTQKLQVTAGGGNEEQGFGSLRYGTELGRDTTARAYVKGFNRGDYRHLDGTNSNDNWAQVQGGFRLDSMWTEHDAVTVLGDMFQSNINQSSTLLNLTPPDYADIVHEKIYASGANLLGRLQHILSPSSDFTLQAFYSLYKRNEIIDHQTRHTFDIDFQHHFSWLDWHDVIWGFNYRFMDVSNQATRLDSVSFSPSTRNDQYFSIFMQDEMTLIDNRLWLTLGSKFEHNDYSGFEYQPTARLMWSPIKEHYLWTAISRAVRTPSALDANVNYAISVLPPKSQQNPTPFPARAILNGSTDFKAEELLAYEFGYRTHAIKSVSIDVTGFYNQYKSLRSSGDGQLSFNGTALEQIFHFTNQDTGEIYGFEASTTWQMLENWRWDFNYSFLKTHLNFLNYRGDGISPQHKLSLHSAITPYKSVNFDVWFRYTDRSSPIFTGDNSGVYSIPDFFNMDIRLAWKVNSHIELSLTGQNLLNNRHLEYVQESFTAPTEIDRSIYGKIVWQY